MVTSLMCLVNGLHGVSHVVMEDMLTILPSGSGMAV